METLIVYLYSEFRKAAEFGQLDLVRIVWSKIWMNAIQITEIEPLIQEPVFVINFLLLFKMILSRKSEGTKKPQECLHFCFFLKTWL